MKIGVISDTHDNLPRIRAAVDLLNKNKVDLVIHAGDYVSPFSLSSYSDLKCDWTGVFGNNDGDHAALTEKSGGRIKTAPLLLSLCGKKIAVMHDFSPYNDADIIICGHTHLPLMENRGKQLVLNPGEASGWLSGKSSLIILDLPGLIYDLLYF